MRSSTCADADKVQGLIPALLANKIDIIATNMIVIARTSSLD